jgi:hypothetical protein
LSVVSEFIKAPADLVEQLEDPSLGCSSIFESCWYFMSGGERVQNASAPSGFEVMIEQDAHEDLDGKRVKPTLERRKGGKNQGKHRRTRRKAPSNFNDRLSLSSPS